MVFVGGAIKRHAGLNYLLGMGPSFRKGDCPFEFWARGESTVIKCKTDIGISDPTVTDCKNFIRDVCNEMVVVRDPCTIGGVGHTVEIDESLLSKNKYHVGRMYPQVWIFGGIDTTTTKDVFIVPVLRRNADLLIPIIQRYILPGTTVISDLWSGYRRLNEFGYTHLTVNHSQNFVDPQTGANKMRLSHYGPR